jgi:hypothetical protein
MQIRFQTLSGRDYLGAVDRDAHVRAARRRQALDALAAEQDRETMLVEQLEDIVAEADGARLDADAFAQMSPDDARLARTALGLDGDADSDAEAEVDDEAETGAADPEDLEAEIARLQEVIESSRRVQAALERYLALLSGQAVA